MLVSLGIANWMSFRDLTKFSMVASKEKQHGERVPAIPSLKSRILPVAAIYGGNASGKTNLFKALAFIRRFILEGSKPGGLITVDPFRLGPEGADTPSNFAVELLIDNRIHDYRFAVTRARVVAERLAIMSRTSEDLVFERTMDAITWGEAYRGDQFLEFAFRGTRENQLFLTNAVSQKVDRLAPVYRWFKECLELVAPDSRFEPFEQFIDEGSRLYGTMKAALPNLDTGIHSLGAEDVPLKALGLPEAMISKLEQDIRENMTVRLMGGPGLERVTVSRRGGELVARKLVTKHLGADGREIRFELANESDGTQRVIDLLPAFLDVVNAERPKTYIIDEVDRSLHHLLTRALISSYLSSCTKDTRNQLLMTTHDVLLMDQSLFRRDEMWVTERKPDGSSTLVAFSDYHDVRYDKDIRKSYLQGRLGGVPHLMVTDLLRQAPTVTEEQ